MICGKHNPNIRLGLFKVYFFMFKNIMQNPDIKDVVIVKDRSKSKKDRLREKSKEIKRIK